MNPLLLLGLGLFLFARYGKAKPTGKRSEPSKTNLTPQGARVATTNVVLQGKLPCIDPKGPARLAKIKDLELQLKNVRQMLDEESSRSQPDEAYIAQLSKDAEVLIQAMTDAAVDHANKCKKYFEDFAKRSATPTQTIVTTTTSQRQV
jgi:hypothetical protein